jgi:hypothetical protein
VRAKKSSALVWRIIREKGLSVYGKMLSAYVSGTCLGSGLKSVDSDLFGYTILVMLLVESHMKNFMPIG